MSQDDSPFIIRDLMDKKGIGVNALSSLTEKNGAKVDSSLISRLITGKSKNPNFETLDRIARALGVEIKDLLKSSKKRECIGIVNAKGGVGKTTTSIMISNMFSKLNKDVVFIDNDPNQNTTKWFLNWLRAKKEFQACEELSHKIENKNIATLLLDDHPNLDEYLHKIKGTSIRLLPSSIDYRDIERHLPKFGKDNLLKHKLSKLECDYIIIDNLGGIDTQKAVWGISNATICVIPTTLITFSMQLMPEVISRVMQIQRDFSLEKPKLPIIFPNMFNSSVSTSHEGLNFLEEKYKDYLLKDHSQKTLYLSKSDHVLDFIDNNIDINTSTLPYKQMQRFVIHLQERLV